MRKIIDRNSLVKTTLDTPEIRTELKHIIEQEIAKQRQEITSASLAVNPYRRRLINAGPRHYLPFQYFMLIKIYLVANDWYHPLQAKGPYSEASNLIVNTAVVLALFYGVLQSRAYHQEVDKKIRGMFKEIDEKRDRIPTEDSLLTEKNITNETIFLAIEKLTHEAISRPDNFVCLISSSVMTEPCYIERRVGDSWVKLDGLFEKDVLLQWLKISGNRIPQTNDEYSEANYRVMHDTVTTDEIIKFMGALVVEYQHQTSTAAEANDSSRPAATFCM